jgi:hypothetical protein
MLRLQEGRTPLMFAVENDASFSLISGLTRDFRDSESILICNKVHPISYDLCKQTFRLVTFFDLYLSHL